MKILLIIRRFLFVFIIFYANNIHSQIITNFAGGGSTLGDGGPATTAQVSNPSGGVFDSNGNYYFSQSAGGPRLRKVDTAGIIQTVAGTGVAGFSGDMGPATTARLSSSFAFTVDDSGNIFIADWHNYRIRKIDKSTGIIHTIAGTGVGTVTGNGGPATSATLYANGICLDHFGNLYLIDSAGVWIRKIDVFGYISSIAGNGTLGNSGDGGMATAASIAAAIGICTDISGNVYIGCDSVIRKINVSTGIITKFAGMGAGFYTGDGMHADSAGFIDYGLCFDDTGNLYIADYNNRVRKIDTFRIIHTVAGNGIIGYSGDGALATDATIHFPQGVAIDKCGNLYIADEANNHIRKVTFNPACDPTFNINVEKTVGDIFIYPNPCFETLQIDNLTTAVSYVVYNTTGIELLHGTLKNGYNSIFIKPLPAGMYLLQLADEYGAKTVHKIIKQ